MRWADSLPPARAYISAISLLELELGVLRIERRDPRQGQALCQWLLEVEAAFAERILPFDARAARRCAGFHVPDPRPDRDAMIAATAAGHDLMLATRNVRDFEGLDVRLVNPWDKTE